MTTIVDRFRDRMELPGLKLTVVAGPDQGKQILAQRGVVRVGAARDNDLVLSDPAVSRRHLSIQLRSNEIFVEDLGSTNGTRIDGVRVYQAQLAAGALVQIGTTSIRASAVEQPLRIALSTRSQFGAMLGESVAMRQVFAILERVAPTDATVLVQGETGTGKELVAEALHSESNRSEAPFVTFDCSAVAPNLIESELFGHVRGAFTGAVSDRRGVFESAHGGTLFLDEIGELPLEVQPKLLRVLETRHVSRLGEVKWHPVDVRVVAATHRDLAVEINRGQFREDLYFRLAVITVALPSLRQRQGDLPLLVRHFWNRFSPESAPPEELIHSLSTRSWPGNVRELRNAVERAVVLQTHESAAMHPIEAALTHDFQALLDLPLTEAQERLETAFWHAYLEHALRRSGGSVSGAARLVGTNRRYIQRLMKRYDFRFEGDGPERTSRS